MTSNHEDRSKHLRSERPIDPLLQRRLLDLTSRRPGAQLPPPGVTARPGGPAPTGRPSTPVKAARAGKRVKPARGSKAASLVLSLASTAGLAVLFAGQDTPTGSAVLTPGTVGTAPTTPAPVSTVPTAAPSADGSMEGTAPSTGAGVTTAPVEPGTGGIVDGTYPGAASQNRWGVVQVQAVYSGGQLIDVQILRYPDGDRKSIAINQRALPRLIEQAIAVQSAAVDNVSGATYTARSYEQSLQSAIDVARAASGLA